MTESEQGERYRILSLDALVRVKLTALRDKDRVHPRDLIEGGLINSSWRTRLPPELGLRPQGLLDTPGG